MEKYVALWMGHDGILGRTIFCDGWQKAVEQCVKLAAEGGEILVGEDLPELDQAGYFVFSDGNAVHIGGLEDAD
jgi:hypothetical protein